MSVTVWYFQRTHSGQVRVLPRARVQSFFEGATALPAGENGLVHLVEVVVEIQDRRAIGVGRVGFFKQRVLTGGHLDTEHRTEVMAAIAESTGGWLHLDEGADLIEAGHRFARRKLEHLYFWKPDEADLRAIRDAVNRKARRDIV